MGSQENWQGRVHPSLINSWRLKGAPMGQGWLPALRGEVLRDKNGSLLCLEVLWKACSECPSFLHKVKLFSSRKPVYFLPCPKLEMQNTSFTTEPLSIKSMGVMQELEVDWIKAVPAGNLLTHPTLLTDTTQIQSYVYAWSQDRQNTAFLQRSISLSPSSLDISQRGKKWDCFKVGSSVYSQYTAAFPTSPWHGSHYTADVAFPLSLSSLFPPPNHFLDQLNWLGQKKLVQVSFKEATQP